MHRNANSLITASGMRFATASLLEEPSGAAASSVVSRLRTTTRTPRMPAQMTLLFVALHFRSRGLNIMLRRFAVGCTLLYLKLACQLLAILLFGRTYIVLPLQLPLRAEGEKNPRSAALLCLQSIEGLHHAASGPLHWDILIPAWNCKLYL